jgi:hypothetical protein
MICMKTFYDPPEWMIDDPRALQQLNEWLASEEARGVRVISIESKGGGKVSKDSDVCYSTYLKVWYEEA